MALVLYAAPPAGVLLKYWIPKLLYALTMAEGEHRESSDTVLVYVVGVTVSPPQGVAEVVVAEPIA